MNYTIGQTVRIMNLPKTFNGDRTLQWTGVIKQISKKGKIMATINKWNYWLSPNDIRQDLEVFKDPNKQNDLKMVTEELHNVTSNWTKDGKPISVDDFMRFVSPEAFKSFSMTPEVEEDLRRRFPMTQEEKDNLDKVVKEMIDKFGITARQPLFKTGNIVRHKENKVEYVIKTHLKEYDYDNKEVINIYYFVFERGKEDINNKPYLFEEEKLTNDPPTRKFKALPRMIEAYQTERDMIIHTLEGDMKATAGDWVVTGIKGEHYAVKPDIFKACYEEILPDPAKPAKKLKEGDLVIMLSNRESDVVEKDMGTFDPANGWMFRLKTGRIKGERELMLLSEYDEKRTIQPGSPYPKAKFEEGQLVALPETEKNPKGLIEHAWYGDNGWVYDVKIFDELNNKFENKNFAEHALTKSC